MTQLLFMSVVEELISEVDNQDFCKYSKGQGGMSAWGLQISSPML